jgi:hypothetical protein
MKLEHAASASRSRVALVLAVAALGASVVGALGPAEDVRSTYTWPPRAPAAERPDRLWYTPLLVNRRQPAAIVATVPCDLPPALPRAARPLTVLATTRFPVQNYGFAVRRRADTLIVSVGATTLAQPALQRSPTEPTCKYVMRLGDGRWSLEGGPRGESASGALEAMPQVSGLFTALDLRPGPAPSIEVTTAVHASRVTALQVVAWSAAVLLASTALILVSLRRRPHSSANPLARARRAARKAHPVDGAVGVTLLGWWVVAPAFYDDGWITTSLLNYPESGGFSSYYNGLGVNSPLGFWLEWSQHWVAQISPALVVQRVPALCCLAATWVLCRWVFARAAPRSLAADRAALWTLASAFCVGAFAWGMTLRQEPFVALLVVGVLLCTSYFVERGTVAPLSVALVLVALAVTAHPAGLVALAPLLAALPRAVRWARRQPAAAAALVTATAAVFLVLAFVGSDLQQVRADAETQREVGDAVRTPLDELARYVELFEGVYQPPARKASAAIILLSILAFAVRRRVKGRPLFDLPSFALWLSLFLLVATPSKWPQHFGTLLGLAAVAAACETARLREEAAQADRRRFLRLLVIPATALVAVFVWYSRDPWNVFDLRHSTWRADFESQLSITVLAILLPVLFVGAVVATLLIRGDRERLRAIPWQAARWALPVLAVPVVAFTALVLLADAAKTDSWTLARQNVDVLRRTPGCGVADVDRVAVTSSMRPLPVAGKAEGDETGSVPVPPVDGLARFALRRSPAGPASSRTPWFAVTPGERIGFFAGVGREFEVDVEWGRRRSGRVEETARESVPVVPPDVLSKVLTWLFVPLGERSGQDADAVRLALPPAGRRSIAVTGPVAYEEMRLERRLASSTAPALVMPNVRAYVPCVRQPQLAEGIVEVPGVVIGSGSTWPLGTGTSPFDGIFDLYRVNRLPLTTSARVKWDVAVFEVDTRIPGARIVPAEKALD